MNKTYDRIYAIVRRIPRGRVATYGQIARLAGLGGHARQVGYALNALPDGHDVPWHRVINAQGGISKRSIAVYEQIQQELLEQEGVEFGTNARVSLQRYQWNRQQK
jgi:methylated-DNA-protein-cysteine methyltransferase-like protein